MSRFPRRLRQALLGAALALAPAPLLATVIDVGPDAATFTNLTRGFSFTAPVDMIIVGLDVPTDRSVDNFDVAVVRFSTLNPVSGAASVYDLLFLAQDQSAALTGLSLAVSAGDVIGVLGSRGETAVNSYGTAEYASSILGNAVTLNRLVFRAALRSESFPFSEALGSELTYPIGRVFVDVEAAPVSDVPAPAALPLLAAGLGALVVFRRRA